MKPRQIPWKWLLLLGLIALTLVGLATLPQRFSDSSRLANRVTDALSAWSGGEVKLTGPLRVRYFPDVSIKARFELTNASRFPLVKSVTASNVRLSLDLAELMLGRISIDAMRLSRLEITLKEVPSLVMGPDQTLEARVVNLLSGAPVGVVRIRDGIIRLPQAPEADAIKAIDARFDVSSGTGAMTSFGSFVLRNETLGFVLDCNAASTTEAGLQIPFNLTLTSKPVTAKVTGIASFVNGLQLDGNLQADMPSARAFLRWTGVAMPEGPSLQRLSASGPAHWNGTVLTFDDGSFALDGNNAVGVLAITPGIRPRIDGTLDFERLVLDPYFGQNALAAPASAALVDQTLLKYFDADLRISAAEITAPSAIRLGRGGFTISAQGGLLASEVGELEFCGGQASARIGFDLSKDLAKAALTASLSDVPFDVCLKAFDPDLPVSGVGSLKADLTTQGRSYDELVQGLAGTFRIKAEDGAVPIDLSRLLTSAAPLDGNGWSRNSVTLFDQLDAECRLAADHIWCETFNMQTRRGLVSGTGQVDLGQQTLDWSLFLASSAQPINASQLSAEIPPRISISGSLLQPMIRRADRPTLGEGSVPANPAAGQVSPR